MKTSEAFFYHIKSFYIKLFHWEYWPMWIVYFPVSFYYLYLALKSKSFFFFSSANPSIETGGMFFESKWKIFELIPKEYFPTTLFIEPTDNVFMILEKMKKSDVSFPIIAKPDRGERGWLVQKIHSLKELESYRNLVKVDFLIQSYVNQPMEFSIFYFRHPKNQTGSITSITRKQLLTVRGDGKSTIAQLMKRENRSFLQYKRLRNNATIDFNTILPEGIEQVLVPYGNHVLGAMFLDYHHIIDKDLLGSIEKISKQIKGFYFGRFDLRANSIEDLKKGKNISILELNGAGAEPAHIYDPSFSFFKAQRVLARHYKMMYQAAYENKKAGFSYMTFQSFLNWKKAEKQYKLKAYQP